MSARTPVALAIAGSDSSAGAGLQADLKTFSALGVYGATVVTAVTAQNTKAVTAIHMIPPEVIEAQIDAVFSDLAIAAVKTGMLGNEETVIAIAKSIARWASGLPIIVDPVMISSTGSRLMDRNAEVTLKERLISQATLLTPNLHEAAALLGAESAQSEGEMKLQAEKLRTLGPIAVLIKGGHSAGANAVDLYFDGNKFRFYRAAKISSKNTHGTGCTLASAITAYLVRGLALEEAIAQAKDYVHDAIQFGRELKIGSGAGPVSHFHRPVN